MKPSLFTYHAPKTLAETLELLATQPNARVLAGGQSLMPMLNMRVLAPDHLIDVNRVAGLAGIEQSDDGISIGAMTRQRDIEFSPLIAARLPLLAEAITWVGHRQTRNRGTIGGSLCHLDPSAEQPAVAMAMDAMLTIAGPGGTRELAMRDFAADMMTTALAPEEMLLSLWIKPWREGHGWAFVEFARRHGDFAIVAVAVLLELDDEGRVSRASLTLGGVAPTPQRMPAAEAAMLGTRLEDSDIAEAARLCTQIDALEDPHAPAWYRQRLAETLAARAIRIAFGRAVKGGRAFDYEGGAR
jgi:carbon-monoxide dehydrogenase medium subunit